MKLSPQLLPVQLDAPVAEAPESVETPFELPEDALVEESSVASADEHERPAGEAKEHEQSAQEDTRDSDDRTEIAAESEEREDEVWSSPERFRRDDREDTAEVSEDRESREVAVEVAAIAASENARDVARRRLGLRARETAAQRLVQADAKAQRTLTERLGRGAAEVVIERGAFAPNEEADLLRPDDNKIAGSKLEAVQRGLEELGNRMRKEAGTPTRKPGNTTADKLAQMRAVERATEGNRDNNIARDLLQNVLESRMDEAHANNRVARAAARNEGVRTAVTENVAREVHKVFKKASEKRAQTLEASREADAIAKSGDVEETAESDLQFTAATPSTSTHQPVVATQMVTTISGASAPNAAAQTSTTGLDPEVAEALKNVRTEDPGDTVLRLRETDAGQLEVRIRSSGDNLMVLVKAEEQALRQKMVDGLPELRRALDKAELVAGRVDVAEYGAFENETRGDSESRNSSAENSFEDNLERQAQGEAESMDGSGARADNDPDAASSRRATTPSSSRTEDGRLHVIV